MYGQMTAGSWIYIGSQGILQGTYETFAAAARRHFGGSLSGNVLVTAGLGGMGGAQPLAATMNGAAALVVEVDRQRIERRIATRYLDEWTTNLDDALATSTHGGAIASRDRSASRRMRPTCCRSSSVAGSHPMSDGSNVGTRRAQWLVPHGMSLAEALALRSRNPDEYIARAMQSMARHVEAMLALKQRGAVDVRLRQQHQNASATRGHQERV